MSILERIARLELLAADGELSPEALAILAAAAVASSSSPSFWQTSSIFVTSDAALY